MLEKQTVAQKHEPTVGIRGSRLFLIACLLHVNQGCAFRDYRFIDLPDFPQYFLARIILHYEIQTKSDWN